MAPAALDPWPQRRLPHGRTTSLTCEDEAAVWGSDQALWNELQATLAVATPREIPSGDRSAEAVVSTKADSTSFRPFLLSLALLGFDTSRPEHPV